MFSVFTENVPSVEPYFLIYWEEEECVNVVPANSIVKPSPNEAAVGSIFQHGVFTVGKWLLLVSGFFVYKGVQYREHCSQPHDESTCTHTVLLGLSQACSNHKTYTL